MYVQRFARRFSLILTLGLSASIAGCGIFAGQQREHHFNDDESTALILDAKQRVITQRTVQRDPQYQGKIDPKIVICAEPSPDVANALSSALSTSLAAGLPTGAGAKQFSADLSLSQAESIVQLGSRIATIQLLRDELADLCRSYANGAVTATTYTLRLSRLDKKMVTLLLSEAAGRPSGTQTMLLSNATAGTRPGASQEELGKARQAVVDASSALVAKDKELKDATDPEQKKTKQAERDAALKELQDKQALLLAMERRLLDTSAGAELQVVSLNNTAPGPGPAETLASLQENFLLQDDLTTFLDACISSLDLLKSDREAKAESTLEIQRREWEASELALARAKADVDSAGMRRNRSEGEEKRVAQEKLDEALSAVGVRDAEASTAKQRYSDTLAQLQPVSRFGDFCQRDALPRLIQANVQRIDARFELIEQRRRLIEAQTREATLRICETALRNVSTMDEKTKQSCANALSRETGSLREAAVESATAVSTAAKN